MALTSSSTLPLQKQKANKMAVVSEAQRKHFDENRDELSKRGVNVDQEIAPQPGVILPPKVLPKKRLTFGQRLRSM